MTALVYGGGCVISDFFVSTLPSARITPIWFSSAFSFSLFFYFGHHVIPGIIIGSGLGLVPGFTNFDPPLFWWQFCFLEVTFTTAMAVESWLGYLCLKNSLVKVKNRGFQEESYSRWKLSWRGFIDPISFTNPFHRLQTTMAFIKAASVAPMVSASMGIVSLIVLQRLPWDEVIYTWLTWWLGSALAIIIFSPILIGFEPQRYSKRLLSILVLCFIISILIGFFSFGMGYPLAYLFLPLLLAIVFYFGRFLGSIFVAIIAIISIILTYLGQTPFATDSPNDSIIFVQIFSSVLSAATLLFAALIKEKKTAQESLFKAINSLENQVKDQSRELSESKLALQESNDKLKTLINLDKLTGIANRSYFENQFEIEWHRPGRAGEPLTLMVLDIDCFNAYNDHYGYAQGDVCLQKVARLLKESLQSGQSNFVARYGGGEFVVLLPNVDIPEAIAVAERILGNLKTAAIPHQSSSVTEIVTISIGIAVTTPHAHFTRRGLFVRADEALYKAKERGKNQYQIWHFDP
ncbi:diguanylate cyclase [Synechocystis salina LEGE 06155]|nr:diguanylate cyclase [Synechocystis salina LEGE 06155]